jgi:MoaA/NifB/PqqE/SkfB family radical SAM enzyme
MTPEMQKAYDDSCIPFYSGGGAIGVAETKLRGWRFFLEINSVCNLRCPTCTKGNQPAVDGLKYDHQTGIMDEALMERCLDKIQSENPKALVYLYGNSEGFIHPRLPECIASVKRRGLSPQLSSNLNFIQRVPETLEAGPDLIIVSLSGWTQEVYEKGHAGGRIDKVKENMRILAEANNARPEDKRVNILVNFHVYLDNGHEIAPMKEYAKNLGLGFFTSFARAISMESTIQYERSLDPSATPFEVQEGMPDWNKLLPPVSQTYVDTMKRLFMPPTDAREMYKDKPMSEACPVGAGMLFTFIRHDGLLQMCACTADRRITLGNYLDLTPEQMMEKRFGHSICKQCLSYRNNLYYNLVDREKWESPQE